jgi:tRNA-binding protein
VHDETAPQTTVDTFFQVDIRVGRIMTAQSIPKARKPAYELEVDFGPLGVKRSSAQLTALYAPQQLVGRQVLAVVNFPPRQVAGVESEVLVLGVPDEQNNVMLLSLERDAPLGARVF